MAEKQKAVRVKTVTHDRIRLIAAQTRRTLLEVVEDALNAYRPVIKKERSK